MRKTTAMNSLFSALLVLACLLLILQVTNLISMRKDDAYGREMSRALGILLSIGIWGILAVLITLARTRGPFPSFLGWAVLVLLPASLAAIIAVHKLFRNPPGPAWLIPPV